MFGWSRICLFFDTLCVFGEPVSGIGSAVENDIFSKLKQFRLYLGVNLQHGRIYYTHIQSGRYGVVKEYGMHGFADLVVAPERKRQVADAAAYLCVWQILLDPPDGFDKVRTVVVVFLYPGRYGQNIGVEDYIFGRESVFGQYFIGAAGDFDFACIGVGLTFFVEQHYDCSRAVLTHKSRLADKFRLALLERYGVDYAFALYAFESCLQHLPRR